MNEPIQGEPLLRALENQKPDPQAIGAYMSAEAVGVLHPPGYDRFVAEEARRDAAHAKAMKSGWTTSEGVLTALVAIGGLATAFGTMASFLEDLARLFPQYGALAAGGIILGALGTAAKAVGDYAKARAAVKGAGRLLVALLAVGLSMPAMAAPVRRAVLLDAEAGQHVAAVAAGEEAPMSPLSLFSLGGGLGVSVRSGTAVPMAELLGTLGLFRLGGGVLSLAAGGSLFLGAEARPGALLALTYDLPGVGGTTRPYLGAGAAWGADGASFVAFVGAANLLL